jgi:hypothetical protein
MELIFERYNLKAGYELEKWQKAQQKWEREASQGATVPQIEGVCIHACVYKREENRGW